MLWTLDECFAAYRPTATTSKRDGLADDAAEGQVGHEYGGGGDDEEHNDCSCNLRVRTCYALVGCSVKGGKTEVKLIKVEYILVLSWYTRLGCWLGKNVDDAS